MLEDKFSFSFSSVLYSLYIAALLNMVEKSVVGLALLKGLSVSHHD